MSDKYKNALLKIIEISNEHYAESVIALLEGVSAGSPPSLESTLEGYAHLVDDIEGIIADTGVLNEPV